jgi:AmmeMemoRadiSam system protein B/AmmeMemoRadiSam system protein A
VASAAYQHIARSNPARIILLGFSHRHGIAGVAVPDIEALVTPLGAVDVDSAAMLALPRSAPFRSVPEELVCDHSVEIQLPFLQAVAPAAKLVPLYVGRLSRSERFAAAERLRELLDSNTVLVASSDFTHYGSQFGYTPFALDESTPDRLRRLDREVMDAAGTLDPAMFIDELHRTESTLCGSEPIALLLETLRGLPGEEIFQEPLDYQTSGEITSDYSHCVSYAALGYFRESAFHLGSEARREVLNIARAALANQDPLPRPESPELDQRRNVFVTIYQSGDLRGCIGCCRDPEPLWAAAPNLALSCLEDRRFEPVNSYEPVDIEISLLTPFKRVRNRADLIAGQHGGYLEARGRCGVLLPKVATERGWKRPEFLHALAMKAGVPTSVYDDPFTRLSVFRAQVFSHDRSVRAAQVQ